MASPPRALTLRKEDYPEAAGNAWMARLFQQLNDFFSAAVTGLNRGLTRSENLRSTVKVVRFTTRTTPADTFPLSVKHDLGQRPSDVWVGALRRTDGTPITSAWSLTWEIGANGDLAVRFQGLTGGAEYEARVILE